MSVSVDWRRKWLGGAVCEAQGECMHANEARQLLVMRVDEAASPRVAHNTAHAMPLTLESLFESVASSEECCAEEQQTGGKHSSSKAERVRTAEGGSGGGETALHANALMRPAHRCNALKQAHQRRDLVCEGSFLWVAKVLADYLSHNFHTLDPRN